MNIKHYKFLCNTKVLYSIQNLPYMVIGSSMSQKACDKVFLNSHIWSLGCQCRGSMLQSFTEWPFTIMQRLMTDESKCHGNIAM